MKPPCTHLPLLTGCDRCGRAIALYYPLGAEHLCPGCVPKTGRRR